MSILIVLHIVICLALIMIVLLQTGKGADMGAAFGGGGSQALFGSTGASTFLGKLTTIVAIVFMLTSLILAYFSGHKKPPSIMKQSTVIEQTATDIQVPSAPPIDSPQPVDAPIQKNE